MSLINPLIHGLAEDQEVSLSDSLDKKNFNRKVLSELESVSFVFFRAQFFANALILGGPTLP